MITPTNGRIVWVHHRRFAQPLAAIVSYVHSDTAINVCCFWPDGTPMPMKNVILVQDTADSDINVIKPYATWMPYQKGQAAKTEALEAALKPPASP
jgi:hypothetical protein